MKNKMLALVLALLFITACSKTNPSNIPKDQSETPNASVTAISLSGNSKTFVIDPEQSSVSYHVGETLINQENKFATAIGVTQRIEGEISFDSQHPHTSTVGTIVVDISAFTSDNERRDHAIRQRWLESATYPIATFVPTKIEGLPERYVDGQQITLHITGDLTIRERTKSVVFETTGVVNGDEMTGKATATIQMTDFGFSPPDIAGILKAENHVAVTFAFVARTKESIIAIQPRKTIVSNPTANAQLSSSTTTPQPVPSFPAPKEQPMVNGPAKINVSVSAPIIELPPEVEKFGQATIIAELLQADGTSWQPPDNQQTLLLKTSFGTLSDTGKAIDSNGKVEVTLDAKIAGKAKIDISYIKADQELHGSAHVEFVRKENSNAFEIAFQPGMPSKRVHLNGIGMVEIPDNVYDIPIVLKFTAADLAKIDLTALPQGTKPLGGFFLELYFPEGELIIDDGARFPKPITLTYQTEEGKNPYTAIWNLDQEEWVKVPSEVSGSTVTSSLKTYGDYLKLVEP